MNKIFIKTGKSITGKGKDFLGAYYNQLQDDFSFKITAIIEIITLIAGYVLNDSPKDYMIIHIPTGICLLISLLNFYVRNSGWLEKKKQELIDWNMKG